MGQWGIASVPLDEISSGWYCWKALDLSFQIMPFSIFSKVGAHPPGRNYNSITNIRLHPRSLPSWLTIWLETTLNKDIRSGLQFLRQLAEFRHFQYPFRWSMRSVQIQWENKWWGGGGISQELLVPQTWFTYQNLQNFMSKWMKIFSNFHLYHKYN